MKAFDLQTCTWSTLKTYGKAPVFIYSFLYAMMRKVLMNLILAEVDVDGIGQCSVEVEISVYWGKSQCDDYYLCFAGVKRRSICNPCWDKLGHIWWTRCKEISLE